MHIPCIYLHIRCIYLHIRCISGAWYSLHMFAYFLHIQCIFCAYYLHILCIFSEFMCIFLAYDCIFSAYFCIFIAYARLVAAARFHGAPSSLRSSRLQTPLSRPGLPPVSQLLTNPSRARQKSDSTLSPNPPLSRWLVALNELASCWRKEGARNNGPRGSGSLRQTAWRSWKLHRPTWAWHRLNQQTFPA